MPRVSTQANQTRRNLAIIFILTFCLLVLSLVTAPTARAASQGATKVAKANIFIEHALIAAKQGDLTTAKSDYQQFDNAWSSFEDTVKTESAQAYQAIESKMGQVEYALPTGKQTAVVGALQALLQANARYIHGLDQNGGFHQQDISLATFVTMLQQTSDAVMNHNQPQAQKDIADVRESWLSVEGTVVAQSETAYNRAERDMVTVNAMISSANYQGAEQTLKSMIDYLSPLAGKNGYTMWDAAMIPIREGLEALLVVAALLAVVNRSEGKKGKGFIWSGVGVGLGVSIVLAIVVKLVFSSGAFGQNNFLISGWTGVIAAVMLLYMSYWLHSKSNVAEWNRYIRSKSQSALATGRLISLGVLAFLAIFREGTETVLFIIGMVNQITMRSLVLGLLIGLAILAVIAYLMLFVGIKLPIRPFFIVSSLIVFYLCLKFTGLGIHSLQLGGALPSTTSSILPTISLLGFFPTWQSAVPQFALLLAGLTVVGWKQMVARRKALSQPTQS